MLENISWVFGQEPVQNKENFVQEVREYQEDIHKKSDLWIPDEILIHEPKTWLLYEAWIRNREDLHDNEVIADDDWDEEETEDGMFQVEILALLEAENQKNFTAAELLMKAHNQMSNKELGDHIFFEGFIETQEYDDLPVYYISCGS